MWWRGSCSKCKKKSWDTFGRVKTGIKLESKITGEKKLIQTDVKKKFN